jgi:hypothetical protein
MIQIWALYRQSGSDLEEQPTDLRRRHDYIRDGTLAFSRLRRSHGPKTSLSSRNSTCDAGSRGSASLPVGKKIYQKIFGRVELRGHTETTFRESYAKVYTVGCENAPLWWRFPREPEPPP